jgi:hypothetical protein
LSSYKNKITNIIPSFFENLQPGFMLFIFTFGLMYIYSVTVNIAAHLADDWLKWMKEKHIPDVIKTGCFIDNRILKLLYVEDEGQTYSVQYHFLELADIEKYQKEFAPALQAEHKARYGDNYSAFRALLEVVE